MEVRQDVGITINKSKSVFGVNKINYLGHILADQGISVDPARVEAIKQFRRPENKTELLRFLGMINFIAKSIQNRSQILEPLHSLLKSNIPFLWTKLQETSFNKIKNMLSTAPLLAYYNPKKNIVISSDASGCGIGACLFQEDSLGNREAVAYISRTLTPTERHYAQIEREALGLTWAAEKWSDFITGIHVTLETDHKPLLQILQTKNSG